MSARLHNYDAMNALSESERKAVGEGKCKRLCGRFLAKGHYECHACRSKFYRLSKKQKASEQPSESELLKLEVARLNSEREEREVFLESLETRVNVLQNRLNGLETERNALDLAFKNLMEKYLQRESLVRSGPIFGSQSVENISRLASRCVGCREDLPSQRAHCDPETGCLAAPVDEEE